ncbi:MAG TPA: hypothetical protein VMW36_02900 [Patescibacteria group bacterium]|nr:hypothetical protein [Patescibacteria group bacterium]
MADFIIEAYELHAQKYKVEGVEDKTAALQAFQDGEATCMDNEGEYIELADRYNGAGLPPAIRDIEED